MFMYYVYVIYDKLDKRSYIGFTKDLERRIKEHFSGGNKTTAKFKSKELIFHEGFINEQDALRRERYFKTTSGKRALKLMLKETFGNIE